LVYLDIYVSLLFERNYNRQNRIETEYEISEKLKRVWNSFHFLLIMLLQFLFTLSWLIVVLGPINNDVKLRKFWKRSLFIRHIRNMNRKFFRLFFTLTSLCRSSFSLFMYLAAWITFVSLLCTQWTLPKAPLAIWRKTLYSWKWSWNVKPAEGTSKRNFCEFERVNEKLSWKLNRTYCAEFPESTQ